MQQPSFFFFLAFHDLPIFSAMDNCQKQPFSLLVRGRPLKPKWVSKKCAVRKQIITLTSSLSSDHIFSTEGCQFPVAFTDFCAAAALRWSPFSQEASPAIPFSFSLHVIHLDLLLARHFKTFACFILFLFCAQ